MKMFLVFQVGRLCLRVVVLITTTAGYIGQLNLLTLAGWEMSTDHSAVMRCGRVVNNNNNNNNNHDNIYGAIVMTKVIERVHPVHFMNVY